MGSTEENPFHLQFLNRKRPVGTMTIGTDDRQAMDKIARDLNVSQDANFSEVVRAMMKSILDGKERQSTANTEQSQKQSSESKDRLPEQSENKKTEQSTTNTEQSEKANHSIARIPEGHILLRMTERDLTCLKVRVRKGKSESLPQMARQALDYLNKGPLNNLFTGQW